MPYYEVLPLRFITYSVTSVRENLSGRGFFFIWQTTGFSLSGAVLLLETEGAAVQIAVILGRV